MFKTTISIQGSNLADLQKTIDRDIAEIKSTIKEMGQAVATQMKENVSTGIHRNGSSGKLANAIDMTITEDDDSILVGIGNIDTLNTQVPYWFVVNYGVSFPKGSTYADAIRNIDSLPKFIPGGGKLVSPGSFAGSAPDGRLAGTGVGTTRWGTGGFTFAAKHPVKPINYIEKSSAWVSQMWGSIWKDKIK